MKRLITLGFLSLLVAACSDGEPEHPWLVIPEGDPYQLVEAEGPGEGQIVLALPAEATPEQALEVGRTVLEQAPAGVVVNARIYNDEATARNWRTVEAQWTLEHLWVLARRTADGEEELRWVGPADVEGAPPPEESSEGASTMPDSAAAQP
jgi:hypothetical protein